MKITFYNSLSNQKEHFEPVNLHGPVTLYSCGPTVYDFAHIGNFRAYMFSDILRRTLEYFGYKTKVVMNITDIDDKTIKSALAKNITLDKYTSPYIKAFFEDIETLGIKQADVYPRATRHIREMLSMIETLENKGYTYRADGSVYFSIKKFKEYGKLSNINTTELETAAHHRIDSDEYDKEHISDFVLWKGHTPQDGDVLWPSPFGDGRPGWHIECSAMSTAYLGPSIDIHTGGQDNRFPHHENEIAQSEGCYGKKFVRYWLHCSHLMVENKKMSKSLGNFFTLRDILNKGYRPEEIRYLLASSHYRNHLNFTFEGLKAAGKSIGKVNQFIEKLHKQRFARSDDFNFEKQFQMKKSQFDEALADDLNTSGALGALFETVRLFKDNSLSPSQDQVSRVIDFFKKADTVFHVFSFKRQAHEKNADPRIKELLDRREKARKNKDFRLSDEIRDEIRDQFNLMVKDTPDGQITEPVH